MERSKRGAGLIVRKTRQALVSYLYVNVDSCNVGGGETTPGPWSRHKFCAFYCPYPTNATPVERLRRAA